jgi:hypothetical protein
VTIRCAVGHMLENPSILHYSAPAAVIQPLFKVAAVDVSDNVRDAENQQERLRYHGWIVGFVDGEGCFSCPIFRNEAMTHHWQAQPSFVVVQSVISLDVLEEMRRFFGCGRVYVNRRYDNHREDLCRYTVSRFAEPRDIIVPFFQQNPLRTTKRHNFVKFARIIELMDRKRHLTVPGIVEVARIAETMNHRKPSEVLRILRDHTPTISPGEGEMKRWSGPYGDVGRPAETTGPPVEQVQTQWVFK